MGAGRSGRLVVWVAFERVELDAVQLLKALPAALASEVVLNLCRVLLHVPVERCTLPALVPANLAPEWSRGGSPETPLRPDQAPPLPSTPTLTAGASLLCVCAGAPPDGSSS